MNRLVAALLTPLALLTGCDAAEVSACGKLEARLLACGLIRPGSYACDEPQTALALCRVECRSGSSCAELERLFCGPERGPALAACESACELAQPLWQCADGNVILERQRCNLAAQCPDGSDERGCKQFTCADGSRVPERLRCDRRPHCSDGSDELGCADALVCGDGTPFSEGQRCDGFWQCADGRDEASCYICGS